MKLGILFGGSSDEHNVSVVSGTSIIESLNKDKYDIYPIYISKDGLFYKYTKNINDIRILSIDEEIKELELIENIVEYLKKIDVVFIALHGINGEDGSVQGMLQLLNIKYIGCNILSSSLCMDKAYTKKIISLAKINQAKSIIIKKYQDKYIYIDDNFNKFDFTTNDIDKLINDYLKYPVFIKPSKEGSSVGVNKALNKDDLIKYLEYAFKFDDKVLIEEEIKGREVECAIIGNNDLIVSEVGEIITNNTFYSYESKYKDNTSSTVIPANVSSSIREEIKNIAKRAYLACDCKGMARIDFFVESDTNRIILNEINTIPGFTEISMYPKLMNYIGITYSDLLDKLIQLALE